MHYKINNFSSKNTQLWNYSLFFLVIILVSGYYHFYEYLWYRPVAFHTWRQTDCTSLALNYFQTDMPFFQPRMHNLLGNEGRTIGEFPIVYWIVGNLYKVLGPKEIIFRVVNLTIFVAGLFYIYKLGLKIFRSVFYSMCLVLVAFSSPIVVFYGISFLPDVPALSISYIAFYYYYTYVVDRNNRDFWIAIILFTLAGLLKVTALIFLCAIVCVLFFELVFIKKANRKLLRNNAWRDVICLMIPFVIFLIWLSYAQYYQKVNNNFYFSLDWDPFWIETKEKQYHIWERISQDWGWRLDLYYMPLIKLSFASLLLLVLPTFNYVWRSGIFAFVCGVSMLVASYYSALYDHDYYFINYLSLVVVGIAVLFYFLSKYIIGKLWLVKGAVAVLVILGVMHNQERMDYRFHQNLAERAAPFYNISEDYLNSKGITKNIRILYDGDNMFNGALYLINRFGWNNVTTNFQSQESIDDLKKKGAKFIFAVGKEKAMKPIYTAYRLVDVAQDSVYIYDLNASADAIR